MLTSTCLVIWSQAGNSGLCKPLFNQSEAGIIVGGMTRPCLLFVYEGGSFASLNGYRDMLCICVRLFAQTLFIIWDTLHADCTGTNSLHYLRHLASRLYWHKMFCAGSCNIFGRHWLLILQQMKWQWAESLHIMTSIHPLTRELRVAPSDLFPSSVLT